MLDEADGIRRKRRESVRLVGELLRSAFLQMFGDPVTHPGVRNLQAGWRLVTVQQVAANDDDACTGGPFGSSLIRADYVATPGVPIIRGNNLLAKRASFRDEDFVFVTDAKAEALRRNLAFPGDIVFTQRGTVGQVAQIPRTARYPRYIISQSQMKLTVNEGVVDPTYLVNYFLSPRGKLDLRARTLATGVPHINLSILKAFPLVLPPLPLQGCFAAFASKHNEALARLDNASCEAARLFDSLVRQSFRAELAAR
jgi:type I restriction enzyme S subunit